jgi:bifunctional non-homologous end joining protein LigD
MSHAVPAWKAGTYPQAGHSMAEEKLARYRAKRDFSKTGEPSGRARVAKSKRLRFIVQKHAARQLHYDLRLELDGVFKSWAVARGPSLNPRDKRLAVEVEDHPLDYGDFEGTIPQGEYGGGTVMLWDRGYWEPEGDKTPQEGLANGDFKFTLEGERLKGSWVLVRMKRDWSRGNRNNWLLIKHRDGCAVDEEGDAILAEDRSVASGRTMEAIAAGEEPGPSPFMSAKKRTAPADAVWNSNRDKPAAKPPAPRRTAGAKPSARKSERKTAAERSE